MGFNLSSTDSIKELQRLVTEFIQKRDWIKYHTPKNLAMSIAIEAAEILELFQWLTNEEALKIVETDRHLVKNLEDELADVMIYCLSLCSIAGIDINQAIRDKLLRNEERFPVHVVSGKLGPYNRYLNDER